MRRLISTSYLKQTKLDKKPDYEEIINIVEPEIKTRIPQRKAITQYRSHFNMLYTNISDERIRELEKQMILQKFSKDYGLNLAAAKAISQAAGNTNYGSPAGSEVVAGTGGGNTPSGGGGGGGVLGAAAAAAAQAAGAIGNFFLSGSGTGSGSGSGGGGGPPSSSHTLLGSPLLVAQQAAQNTPMTQDDYDLERMLEQERQKAPTLRPNSGTQGDIITPHPQPATAASASASPVSTPASSVANPDDEEHQIASEEIVKKETKNVGDLMFNITNFKSEDGVYTPGQYGAAISMMLAKARAMAEYNGDDNIRDLSKEATKIIISNSDSYVYEKNFKNIVKSPEYIDYEKATRSLAFNGREREAEKTIIVDEYNANMEIVQKALKSIKRVHGYLKDVKEQPQQKSPPSTPSPHTPAKYQGTAAATKGKSGKSGN